MNDTHSETDGQRGPDVQDTKRRFRGRRAALYAGIVLVLALLGAMPEIRRFFDREKIPPRPAVPDPVINFSIGTSGVLLDVNLVENQNREVNRWDERASEPLIMVGELNSPDPREIPGSYVGEDRHRAQFTLPWSDLDRKLRIVLKMRTQDAEAPDRWPVQEGSTFCAASDGPSLHVKLRMKDGILHAERWP